MVEGNGEAFAEGIVRALTDTAAAAERSAKALALYERRFSWRIFAAAVRALITGTMEDG